MNKLDHPSKEPLELIDELEKVMHLHAFPVTWPLGSGTDFKGVYERLNKKVHLFTRMPGGTHKALVSTYDLKDPQIRDVLGGQRYEKIVEESELLDATSGQLDRAAVLDGTVSPVFFGSAANNFGVELMLKYFLEYSSAPLPRRAGNGPVSIESTDFSGFIFKVQTNMNPRHRDRMVFLRVCSGKYEQDMGVYHSRLQKKIKLSSGHSVFGQKRENITTAYPGDIVGLVTRSDFRVGDTLSTLPNLVFNEISRFAPEIFAFIHNSVPSNYKSFRKGVEHFLAEDMVQAFDLSGQKRPLPLLGAVGPLQFEVLQYRLKEEYGADSHIEIMPWECLRWVNLPESSADLRTALPYDAAIGTDMQKRTVMLFNSSWSAEYFSKNNRDIQLYSSPEEAGL